MAEPGRYVLVSADETDQTIQGGPFMWDGEAKWTPPGKDADAADLVEAGEMRLESEALDAGYAYPEPDAPPQQEEPQPQE